MEILFCKTCKKQGAESEFHYEGRHETFKTITEVGMKCPHCGKKSVGFYLNKKLVKYQKRMGKLIDREDELSRIKLQRLKIVYYKKFHNFQDVVAGLEATNG